MRAIAIFVLVVLSALPSAAEDVDSHRSAAAELLELSGMERMMSDMAPVMSRMIVSANPLFQPYRSVIEDWAAQTMVWKNFEGRFIDTYVEAFSEAELREMIAFFRTPTGQKAVRLQPEMMLKGNQFGEEVAREHSAELEAMLAERKAEIESLNTRDEAGAPESVDTTRKDKP